MCALASAALAEVHHRALIQDAISPAALLLGVGEHRLRVAFDALILIVVRVASVGPEPVRVEHEVLRARHGPIGHVDQVRANLHAAARLSRVARGAILDEYLGTEAHLSTSQDESQRTDVRACLGR